MQLSPNLGSVFSTACAKVGVSKWQAVQAEVVAGALAQLQAIEPPRSEKPGRAEYEVRNLHSLALLMARSALAREESRGSHYRADFPYRDDEKFNKHSIVQKGKDVGFQP